MKMLQILRRISLPAMLLCLLLLSACEEPTGNGPVSGETISGVLNDEQGLIVPGATVEAIDASNNRVASDVSTDEGQFLLKGLPSDMSGIRIQVSREGFNAYTNQLREIISSAGGATGVVVRVMHADSCCARLTLSVSGPNGVALGGVEVKLRKGDRLITTGVTDSAGVLVLSNVCAGEYNLRVAKTGYQVVERGINIRGCDSVRAEVGMKANDKEKEKKNDSCCRGYLRVVPKDSATGANINGAKVVISKANFQTRTVAAGGDGAVFREMCEGTYNVRISKEGYRAVEFTVTLRCNDSVVTDRRLGRDNAQNNDSCCSGSITINLRDSNNAVIAGANVKARKGDRVFGPSVTNNDGRVKFENLCKGEYVINVTKDGFKNLEFVVAVVECNQNVTVTKTMTRNAAADSCCNGKLYVSVKDSTTNAAIANATIKLWKNGAIFRTGVTNANGVLVFEGLCQGSYGLDFIREGYTSREATITLGCNQNLEIGRKLLKTGNPGGDTCCNAIFQFKVKDSTIADGGWLSGVKVVIKRGDDSIATGETNADGGYKREGLCGGNRTYTVTFSKAGFRSKTLTFTITDCRTFTETVKLSRE